MLSFRIKLSNVNCLHGPYVVNESFFEILISSLILRNTFLSSPHLCFIIVFICDLFVSRDDPLMS